MQAVTITQITASELEALIENSVRKVLSVQLPTNQSETDEVLTVDDAARFLSLSVPTIYGLVSKSQIPVSKRGKRLYFSQRELTDWIREGKRKTISEIAKDAQDFIQNKKR